MAICREVGIVRERGEENRVKVATCALLGPWDGRLTHYEPSAVRES